MEDIDINMFYLKGHWCGWRGRGKRKEGRQNNESEKVKKCKTALSK